MVFPFNVMPVHASSLFTFSALDATIDTTTGLLSIYKWNREVSFGIKTAVNPSASSLSGSNRVNFTYSTLGFKLNIYNTTIDNAPTIEYEVIIPAKPVSIPTGFSFQIDMKNLVVYYQPALNESEVIPKGWFANATDIIDENGTVRTHRPENVVGSYAVYHSSKKNNEYGLGQAFQIYRPQLIDAKGNIVWASMNITGNVLTITFPTDFLNEAVYPVTVDPSFGYTSAGTSSKSVAVDSIIGSVFTLTTGSGTADSMSFWARYSSGSDSNNAKCAIYNHSDLSLVGNTTAQSCAYTATYTLYTINFSEPKPSLVNGSSYVLVVWLDKTSNNYYVPYVTGDANQGHIQALAINGFPAPLVPSHDNNKYSIFCNYTVGVALQNLTVDLTLTTGDMWIKSLSDSWRISSTISTGDAWTELLRNSWLVSSPYSTLDSYVINGKTVWVISSPLTTDESYTIQPKTDFHTSNTLTQGQTYVSTVQDAFAVSGSLSTLSNFTVDGKTSFIISCDLSTLSQYIIVPNTDFHTSSSISQGDFWTEFLEQMRWIIVYGTTPPFTSEPPTLYYPGWFPSMFPTTPITPTPILSSLLLYVRFPDGYAILFSLLIVVVVATWISHSEYNRRKHKLHTESEAWYRHLWR
jgi:hypothetical protein